MSPLPRLSDTQSKVTNFVLFQLCWTLNVLMPGQLSALVTVAAVALHLLWISQRALRELRFIVMAAFLGMVVDILWQNLGVLRFPDNQGYYAEGMIPVWLVAIWLIFATTVNHCLYWMRSWPRLTLLMAPFAGAFAYYSAAQIGAVEIGHGLWGLLALALGWLFLFPTFQRISRWMESDEEPGYVEQRW
ncbi:MAG: DUF2878 domain-containing protein [Oleiphilaceae bacterium]|nr:DUF2878 domain-containing protein [Oleiphilaceae bacterium]